jgi:hypothetical protein
MPLTYKHYIVVAAVVAIAGLNACASSSSSPVPLVATPRVQNAPETVGSFAVTIAGVSAAKPQIMNGAQIDIVVTGASGAKSGYVDAAGNRTPLTRAADGAWRATLQYIDETNPPPANPAIDVAMQFAATEETVHHIPIVELHE